MDKLMIYLSGISYSLGWLGLLDSYVAFKLGKTVNVFNYMVYLIPITISSIGLILVMLFPHNNLIDDPDNENLVLWNRFLFFCVMSLFFISIGVSLFIMSNQLSNSNQESAKWSIFEALLKWWYSKPDSNVQLDMISPFTSFLSSIFTLLSGMFYLTGKFSSNK